MSAGPFASLAVLERRFAAGLAAMLEQHAGLGVYILVLANAAQDAGLWARLRGALAQRHQRHGLEITRALRAGRKLAEPEDDLVVFLKLLALGFEHLQPTESRQAGPWEVQFNPIRALRPARLSDTRVANLMQPFDAGGFHFNQPFLAREVLWQDELCDKPARLLYNKFPFAPLHGLLVPEPARQLPQWLTPEMHAWAWESARQVGAAIPGFGLAYNSYGAYASVNHLHFQTFVRSRPLPLLTSARYPLPCTRHTKPMAAWFHLDELHQCGTPYNLIYAAGDMHVIPRARQGSVALEPWSAGFAWSEMAGVFTVYSREDFLELTEVGLAATLARLAP